MEVPEDQVQGNEGVAKAGSQGLEGHTPVGVTKAVILLHRSVFQVTRLWLVHCLAKGRC